jgi:hypothetical protein
MAIPLNLIEMAGSFQRENPFGGDICATASIDPKIARRTDIIGARQRSVVVAYPHAGRSKSWTKRPFP